MILTLEEAKEILRVDGPDLDQQITALVVAIPHYLETTTGKRWDEEQVNPLAHTTAGFILQLWFEPMSDQKDKLKITIDSLLGALTAMARGN